MRSISILAAVVAAAGVAAAGAIDAQPGAATVSIGDVVVDEGGAAVFEVVLSGAVPPAGVQVQWKTEGLTASESADFITDGGVVALDGPGPATREIRVQTIHDRSPEGSETFLVRLTTAKGAAVDRAVGHGVIREGIASRLRCDRDRDGHSDFIAEFAAAEPGKDGDGDTDPTPHGGLHDHWIFQPISTVVTARPAFTAQTKWHFQAAGDFDGDGACDTLWSSPPVGHAPGPELHKATALWITTGADVPDDGATLFRLLPPRGGWRVVGAADLTGDGVTDVLWWDPVSRKLGLWATLSPSSPIPALLPVEGCADEGWEPAGLAQLSDREGPDLLWYAGPKLALWRLSWTGRGLQCPGTMTLMDRKNASLAAVGDFDGDGFDDLLLEDPADHTTSFSNLRFCFFSHRGLRVCTGPGRAPRPVSIAPTDTRRINGPL